MKNILTVEKLSVRTANKELIHDVNLSIDEDTTTIILGPNGAGKTSFVRAIANDNYDCSGKIVYNGRNIIKDSTDKRSRDGIFLSYQEPVSIPGLSTFEMLRSALEARGQKNSLREYSLKITKCLEELGLDTFLVKKDLNTSLSGGEKKLLEVLQLLILEPKIVILDEIDSGLDIDSANIAANAIKNYQKRSKAGIIIITHNMRILKNLDIDKVVVMRDGRIAERGDKKLLSTIKKNGFKNA